MVVVATVYGSSKGRVRVDIEHGRVRVEYSLSRVRVEYGSTSSTGPVRLEYGSSTGPVRVEYGSSTVPAVEYGSCRHRAG